MNENDKCLSEGVDAKGTEDALRVELEQTKIREQEVLKLARFALSGAWDADLHYRALKRIRELLGGEQG